MAGRLAPERLPWLQPPATEEELDIGMLLYVRYDGSDGDEDRLPSFVANSAQFHRRVSHLKCGPWPLRLMPYPSVCYEHYTTDVVEVRTSDGTPWHPYRYTGRETDPPHHATARADSDT